MSQLGNQVLERQWDRERFSHSKLFSQVGDEFDTVPEGAMPGALGALFGIAVNTSTSPRAAS